MNVLMNNSCNFLWQGYQVQLTDHLMPHCLYVCGHHNIVQELASIQLVNTREMGMFINPKGVEWVADSVVYVLNKTNAVEIDKDKWPHKLKEASGFHGDNSDLLKAITRPENLGLWRSRSLRASTTACW